MNTYDVILLDEAESDLDAAFIWYELRKPGLGIDFISNIDNAFRYITQNPLSFEKKYRKTYRHVLTKFPYSIYYQIDKEDVKILVIGILHHKRNPGTWKKRVI